MEKYEKVLKLMQSKPDGRVEMTDPELVAIIGENLVYRLPMYFSNIRRKANLKVKGIRIGRKVVAYQLVALDPDEIPSLTPVSLPRVVVDAEVAPPVAPPVEPIDPSPTDGDNIPPAREPVPPSPEPPSDDPGKNQPAAAPASPSEPDPADEGWSVR